MTADTSPATTLETAYRNADPSAPLPGDHPWYVDLAEAREAIRPGLARSLRLNLSADQSGERNWERVIFVSQRGTGKTTELKRLATELRSSFEVIEVEANAELNSELFDITELLFVIALRVERHMRDVLGTPLDRRLRAELQRWFVDATHADLRTLGVDAEAGTDESFVQFGRGVKGLFGFQNEARTEAVGLLRRRPRDLVDRVNDILDAAHAALREVRPTADLLIIVDNLDRYKPTVVDEALVQGADHVLGLRTNLLLTPPISLVARPETEPINNLYQMEYMHTPRLRGPEDPPGSVLDPGRRLLFAALDKRVHRPSVFADPDAVAERLVALSGGSIRALFLMLQRAIVLATGAKLTIEDVERARKRELSPLRLQVNTSGFAPLLGHVARTHQLGDDAQYMELLYRRWVLAYNDQEWFDLAPLIRDIPEVKAQLKWEPGGAA